MCQPDLSCPLQNTLQSLRSSSPNSRPSSSPIHKRHEALFIPHAKAHLNPAASPGHRSPPPHLPAPGSSSWPLAKRASWVSARRRASRQTWRAFLIFAWAFSFSSRASRKDRLPCRRAFKEALLSDWLGKDQAQLARPANQRGPATTPASWELSLKSMQKKERKGDDPKTFAKEKCVCFFNSQLTFCDAERLRVSN